jgi:hypothetical protein
MFRRWALSWLRADLAEYGKLARQGDPELSPATPPLIVGRTFYGKLTGQGVPELLQDVRLRLEQWQNDSDLASVRDKEALEKLPDDERRAWQQLWDDVDTLLKKVQEPK